MSKRLNKRQQREQDELAALEAAGGMVQRAQHEQQQPGPANIFAALNSGGEEPEDEQDEEADEPERSKPASKKKKPKKKKPKALVDNGNDSDEQAQATPKKKTKANAKDGNDPFQGLDEVDRALAELKLKYKDEPQASSSAATSSAPQSSLSARNLLSVDPKNLDADAELRKFFGSKVVANSSTNGAQARRQAQLAKLRTTLAKPKITWPPPTALSGLTMRELRVENGERWFTFEHSHAWREAQMQFIGATRSHDPNQLFALLQVFPWHVDTLLQMSEVYRLQSDIGAASDYAERALFAFDRCLIPAFNITLGTCRLDFDRVENRPMFTALHRNIAYLGRRGCWLTAFTFAKLLFALDPKRDPHAAALWLDFLAIKTSNGPWLLSLLEEDKTIMDLNVYPGMAYARALALRARDPEQGDHALRAAIHSFPEVVPVLADKIGANIPPSIRSDARFQIRAGYEADSATSVHLLAHLYVSRSDALWKEDGRARWLEAQLALAYETMPCQDPVRTKALAYFSAPPPPIPMRENICRHIMVTESTSYLGFLPPALTQRAMTSYDPLPPATGTTFYDNAYFSMTQSGRHASDSELAAVVARWQQSLRERLIKTYSEAGEGQEVDIQAIIRPAVFGLMNDAARLSGGISEEQKATALGQLLESAEDTLDEIQGVVQAVPGAFPA